MTTLNEARKAVYDRWAAQWAHGAASYCFENEPYAPADRDFWARVSVRQAVSDEEQSTIGVSPSRKFLRRARVYVQVFVKPDSGLKNAGDYATQARLIFEATSFSGLSFVRGASIRETGSDGKWYQVLVDAPFMYEETH